MHIPQAGVPGLLGTFTKKTNVAYNPHDTRSGPKFVRHTQITRSEVVMYDVRTWVDRELLAVRAAAELPPEDCLRVKPSSLKKLASLCPAECPLPSEWPSTHSQVDIEESIAAEDERRAQEEGDDPPPPIPQGFKEVEWEAGNPIKHFMLWTALDRLRPHWYQGQVKRVLKRNRSGYTHDAQFKDKEGVRGVRLSAKSYHDKCWICLAQLEEHAQSAPAPQKRSRRINKRPLRVIPDSPEGDE